MREEKKSNKKLSNKHTEHCFEMNIMEIVSLSFINLKKLSKLFWKITTTTTTKNHEKKGFKLADEQNIN